MTDHQAIEKGLRADTDDELFRWARKLNMYSFTIVHRAGSSIPHADALSRRFTDSAVKRLKQAEEFEIETLTDPVLKYVVENLQGKEDITRPDGVEFLEELSFYDRILAKDKIYLDRGRLRVRVDESVRVVVPRGMRFQIFALAHSHPMAGHPGERRTWARISETYTWFRSKRDVVIMVKGCLVCAKHNTRRVGSQASKKTVPVEGIPLSQWAMDVLGPLPKSGDGNQYILVVTDLLTKWVELFAMPDQKAQTVVECLISVINRYSIPASILSDNGSNFKSNLVKKLFETLQVKPIYTSPYHPESDGQCERFNSTLVQTLRKLIEERPEEWNRKLQYVAFSYRTSKHSVTGYSPYQLVFGRKPREPVHTLTEPDETRSATYLANFKDAEGWRRIALRRINAEKEDRVWQNEAPEYKEGDLVMLKDHRRTSKLSPMYKGPFRVCEEKDPNYVLDIDDQRKTWHANQLKLFLRSGQENRLELWNQNSERQTIDEDEEYESSDSENQREEENSVVDQVDDSSKIPDEESLDQAIIDNVERTKSGREVKLPPRYRGKD